MRAALIARSLPTFTNKSMSISRIISINPAGTWQSSYGPMYSFDVEFEDGTRGQVNAKSQTPAYRVGSEMDYQITGVTPKGQNKLKLQKPDPNTPAPAYNPPPERSAPPARPAPAPQPPRTATETAPAGPVNGATVGFAMKEAIGLHAGVLTGPDLANALTDPVFWAKIESTAARIIAISRGLEQGKPSKSAASHPDLETELDAHGNPF